MTQFSKKVDRSILIISIICLLLSSLLIFVSSYYLDVVQQFLENSVFHREFDIYKWADTIYALMAFPVFAVIFVDICLFLKFDNKSKIILIISYGIVITFFLVFASFTKGNDFIDSDMASELLLGKECFLSKNFLPTSWNYSTEIRMINTQLVTSPLFCFSSNWNIIKGVSAVILSLLLPFSLLFLLNQLKIKKLWLKLLCCLFIFVPASIELWKYVQFGNYYVPHLIIAFLYIGLFYTIVYNNHSRKKRTLYICLYCLLSLFSGLAGIRYILYFQFPLAAVFVCSGLCDLFKNKIKFNFKDFFINNRPVFYGVLGLVIGSFGYILNTLVLSRIFTFSEYNTTMFGTFGSITLSDVLFSILSIFGYKNNVSVFSPSGVINIIVYVFIFFFLYSCYDHLKKDRKSKDSSFFIFFFFMLVFNGFTFVNTDYETRYFILPLAFIIPCLALMMQSNFISAAKKYITLATFSLVIITSTFITFETVLGADENNDKKEVAKFLNESDYNFGYGTFWNANVFTFMTNGKVEMACLSREIEPKSNTLKYDKWLTPDRFYTEDINLDKPVIFIVPDDQYENLFGDKIFENGKLVYNHDGYKIFEYANDLVFKENFK